MAHSSFIQDFMDAMKKHGIAPTMMYYQKYTPTKGLVRDHEEVRPFGKGWLFAVHPAVGDSDRKGYVLTEKGKIYEGRPVFDQMDLYGSFQKNVKKVPRYPFLNMGYSENWVHSIHDAAIKSMKMDTEFRINRLIRAGNAVGNLNEIDPTARGSKAEQAKRARMQQRLVNTKARRP